MKKFYALLLAGVMTVACVMPAMAAPSPTAQVVESAAAVSVPVSGASVAALDRTLAQDVLACFADEAALSSFNLSTNAKVVAAFDLNYSGTIPAGGVQIPVNLSGIADLQVGDYVVLEHRCENLPGKPWEQVGAGILGSDMTIICTFKSFSPVVVVKDAAPAGVTAPKTGEY